MTIYNGSLEVSVRIAMILEAAFPSALDLDELSLVDHAVLHSSDLGGPESVFPANPGRVTELTLKRPLIKEALHLLAQADLVNIVASERGIVFSASEETAAFVSLLESPMAIRLRDRARWAAAEVLRPESSNTGSQFAETLAGWLHQFSDEVR